MFLSSFILIQLLKVSVCLRNFDIFLSAREREQIKQRVATSTTRERRYSIAKKEVCTPLTSGSHDS